MKMRSIPCGLSLAVFLLAIGSQAQAQNNPLITVDERGNGSIAFPGSLPSTLPGVLAPDPGPGGLSAALTYNLGGPPSLVAGDVLLFEPGIGGAISDQFRFNPAGTGGNPAYPASLVLYSAGGDSLGDKGFPIDRATYPNTLILTETGPEFGPNGLFAYTPTANQPGFVPGFAVTYNITSDAGTAVPEPASLVMVGTAVLAGLGYAWRRKRIATV
jgi:hypothetical protein